MTTETEQFEAWLNANRLFDTANFIKDEVDREKAKANNPTWMVWQHQQQRIDKMEKKLAIAVDALKLYVDCGIGAKTAEEALKQIEVK